MNDFEDTVENLKEAREKLEKVKKRFDKVNKKMDDLADSARKLARKFGKNDIDKIPPEVLALKRFKDS